MPTKDSEAYQRMLDERDEEIARLKKTITKNKDYREGRINNLHSALKKKDEEIARLKEMVKMRNKKAYDLMVQRDNIKAVAESWDKWSPKNKPWKANHAMNEIKALLKPGIHTRGSLDGLKPLDVRMKEIKAVVESFDYDAPGPPLNKSDIAIKQIKSLLQGGSTKPEYKPGDEIVCPICNDFGCGEGKKPEPDENPIKDFVGYEGCSDDEGNWNPDDAAFLDIVDGNSRKREFEKKKREKPEKCECGHPRSVHHETRCYHLDCKCKVYKKPEKEEEKKP